MRQKEKRRGKIWCFPFSASAVKPHLSFIVSVALLCVFWWGPLWHWRGYPTDTWILLKTLFPQNTHTHACIHARTHIHYPPFLHTSLCLSISSFLLCSFSHLSATLTQIHRSDHKKITQKKCQKTLTSPLLRGGRKSGSTGKGAYLFYSPICMSFSLVPVSCLHYSFPSPLSDTAVLNESSSWLDHISIVNRDE